MAYRLNPFWRVRDVHWGGTPVDYFDVAVSCSSQLPAVEGLPPSIIYDITTVPPDATQTVTTNIDHTVDIGFGQRVRSINYGVRITGATKVTLDINGPVPTVDLGFVGAGNIEYSVAAGATTDIGAAIGRNPNVATSATADPTMDHPTGVTLDPASAAAHLVYDSTDSPRSR